MKSSHGTLHARTALVAAATMVLLAAAGDLEGGERRMKPHEKAISHLKVAKSLYDASPPRLGEALGAVDRALDEDSSYVPAHQLRGQILVSLDKLDDALKEFDRTLQLDKGYTEARNWKGSVLVQLKRYDDAMREYERALEDTTYPTPERIQLNIGMLQRLMGRDDEAIVTLRKAVALNPSYARGYFELGITYEKLGRDRESLKAYQDALVGMDDSADLNLRLGRALARSGNAPKAKEHFEKVIRLAPDGPEAAQARDAMKKLQSAS